MGRFSSDQRIVVTGASSGLGRAVALHLCREGACVLACGRDTQRLNTLRIEAIDSARMIIEHRDLSDEQDDLPEWVHELGRRHGKLRGLICCAGVDKPGPLALLNTKEAQAMFAINWLAPLLLAKGFADRRVNTGTGAAMVFIASIAAHIPLKGQFAYAASKAALVSSVRNLAQELGTWGIRANCISPGLISTPMTQAETLGRLEFEQTETARTPLGPGRPEDVAALAAFLLSDEARWITGHDYIIDGGRA